MQRNQRILSLLNFQNFLAILLINCEPSIGTSHVQESCLNCNDPFLFPPQPNSSINSMSLFENPIPQMQLETSPFVTGSIPSSHPMITTESRYIQIKMYHTLSYVPSSLTFQALIAIKEP